MILAIHEIGHCIQGGGRATLTRNQDGDFTCTTPPPANGEEAMRQMLSGVLAEHVAQLGPAGALQVMGDDPDLWQTATGAHDWAMIRMLPAPLRIQFAAQIADVIAETLVNLGRRFIVDLEARIAAMEIGDQIEIDVTHAMDGHRVH